MSKNTIAIAALLTLGFAGPAFAEINPTVKKGSSRARVEEVQAALNACNDAGLSEDGLWGAKTTAAVKAFQADNGISRVGFVGPATAAALNDCVDSSDEEDTTTTTTTTDGDTTTTTTTTTSTLTGPEGNLSNIAKLGLYNNTKVSEGAKDVKVMAIELTAKDGDQKIDGLNVAFNNGSVSTVDSNKFSRYASEVSVWLDGVEIGRKLANQFSDDASDIYTFRFSGMNGIVKKDQKSTLVVAVTAINSMDSNDASNDAWTVFVGGTVGGTDDNYISAASANGRYRDFGTATVTSNVDFQKATGDATYKVSTSTTNPVARVVTISRTSDTNEQLLLAFDVKADNAAMLLQKLPITLTVANASPATSAQTVVKNLRLYADGKLVTSESAPSGLTGTVTFGNNTKMKYSLPANTTVKFEVRADLNSTGSTYGNFANGTTVMASYTGSAATVELDNINQDSVPTASMTGSATGELQTLQTKGIKVSLVNTAATTAPIGTSGDINGNFSLTFKVDAIDEDILIDASNATQLLATATPTVAGQGVILEVGGNVVTLGDISTSLAAKAILESSTTDTKDVAGSYFYVTNGQSRTFTVKYENLLPTTAGTNFNVEFFLTSINWVTNSDATSLTAGDNLAPINAADFANYYTSGFTDFKTGQKNLVNAV